MEEKTVVDASSLMLFEATGDSEYDSELNMILFYEGKMEEKTVVDASSSMLFEATGDSEYDSELNMAAMDLCDMDVAEDDAQSCSCELMDCGRIVELGEFDDPGDTHDEDYHVDDGGGGEEELEEEAIDQDWSGGGGGEELEEEAIDQDWSGGGDEVVMSSIAEAWQSKKSRVCVDSAMELMSEMEKNRRFWEACLAS